MLISLQNKEIVFPGRVLGSNRVSKRKSYSCLIHSLSLSSCFDKLFIHCISCPSFCLTRFNPNNNKYVRRIPSWEGKCSFKRRNNENQRKDENQFLIVMRNVIIMIVTKKKGKNRGSRTTTTRFQAWFHRQHPNEIQLHQKSLWF